MPESTESKKITRVKDKIPDLYGQLYRINPFVHSVFYILPVNRIFASLHIKTRHNAYTYKPHVFLTVSELVLKLVVLRC